MREPNERTNWRLLIGKRVMVRYWTHGEDWTEPHEAKVEYIAPESGMMFLRNAYGGSWRDPAKLVFVEELPNDAPSEMPTPEPWKPHA